MDLRLPSAVPLRFAIHVAWFLVLTSLASGQLAKDRPDLLANPIGYTVLTFPTRDQEGNAQQMRVSVWYPTLSTPESFSYRGASHPLATEVAVDGIVAPGSYPLVVYSHGVAGSGASAVFIEESLARAGFVVAAPDHTDPVDEVKISPRDNPRVSGVFRSTSARTQVKDYHGGYFGPAAVANRTLLAYRPRQIKETISALLADPQFGPHLDSQRIGAFGHSFGAWTTLMVSGSVPEYDDPRIKAAVGLSEPVNRYVFAGNELARIRIPLMIMFGEKEVAQGREDDRSLVYDRLNGAKYLLEIRQADHYTFCEGGPPEFSAVEAYLDHDPRRAAITRYTVAFFGYYLRKSPSDARQLSLRGSALTSYLRNAP